MSAPNRSLAARHSSSVERREFPCSRPCSFLTSAADDLVRAPERHALVRPDSPPRRLPAASRMPRPRRDSRLSDSPSTTDRDRPSGTRPGCPRHRRPRACPPGDPCCSRSAILSSSSAAPPDRRRARPVLPRTSSSGSGFFFCGIMLLPVLSASDSSKNWWSSPQRMMRSSARRLRCTIVRAARRRGKLAAKSRSDDASMLLATTRREPEVARQRVDVDVVARSGDRAGAERQRVGFGPRAARKPIVVAPERRHVREKEMRDEHRLRRPEVRERRHQGVVRLAGLPRERRHQPLDCPLEERDAPPQVQAQVERNLLVPGTARVQAPAGVAEPLDELALDEAVDVLVGRRRRRTDRAGRDRESRCRARLDAASLVAAEHAGARSARAQARLPVTSSSKSRRSKPNDEPHSNAAASGAPSKRPDHNGSSRHGRRFGSCCHHVVPDRRSRRPTGDRERTHRSVQPCIALNRLAGRGAASSRATRRIVSSPAIVPTASGSCARSMARASGCACPAPVRSTISCWTRSTCLRKLGGRPVSAHRGPCRGAGLARSCAGRLRPRRA